MSIFSDQLDKSILDKETDKLILEKYKISNSGHTLIPKEGRFALTKERKKFLRSPSRTDKLPTRTFREEHSVFCSIYGGIKDVENNTIKNMEYLYPKFQEIIRGMGLPCLIYNKKRYYQVNREVKRAIYSKIHAELNI